MNIPETMVTFFREMIGRRSGPTLQYKTTNLNTDWGGKDWARADYQYWDRSRHGRTEGLTLAGLLLKPLYSKKASWVLGIPPQWTVVGSKRTQRWLNRWWKDNSPEIVKAYEEANALGDMYIIPYIEPEGNNGSPTVRLRLVSPHVCRPMVNPEDFSEIIGYKIRITHQDPNQNSDRMVVEDIYTKENHIKNWYRTPHETEPFKTETYSNPLGMIPVIHIPNLSSPDEVHGRPEGEALVPALLWYDDILTTALKGNKHQGRPTPVAVFERQQEVEAFFRQFSRKETRTLPDGTTETYHVVDFDSNNFLAIAAKDFKYAQPGSFAHDTEKLLGILFYLVVQHSEIPEFAWGAAIGASKASSETQLLPLARWVEKSRLYASGWVMELATLVLKMAKLFEPLVLLDKDLVLRWDQLTDKDDRLTLDAIAWAFNARLLDEESAIAMMPLPVDDPTRTLSRARTDWKRRDREYTINTDTEPGDGGRVGPGRREGDGAEPNPDRERDTTPDE